MPATSATSFAARLNSALDAIHAPPKHRGRLAWVTGEYNRIDPGDPVRSESVRRWLTGSLPKHARVPILAKLCGVRTEWLLSGRGPRYPEPPEDLPANAPRLSDAECKLLDAYRALDGRDRQRVHRLIDVLRNIEPDLGA